ncbi:hypothetical protein Pmani_006622 [Petrolisthes manimaculis]|uniref:Uncharacterized protein n=1 Tax=Petrolisthes manimaculis TaxID=1843537 RepID=A0AAE1QAM3_9EUCA|nr:hypothetical protein Pmani_006622 [Petrolisthes manimaculis]
MNEAGCTSGVAGDFYELHGGDDSMYEDLLDSSCVTGENIDGDKTSSQQSSDMGDRRTIPRAVQKRGQTDRLTLTLPEVRQGVTLTDQQSEGHQTVHGVIHHSHLHFFHLMKM